MLDVKPFSEVMGEWAEVFMHRSFRDFKRFMDEAGLSPTQANALMRLYHGKLCGVSDIGGHLGITNSAASRWSTGWCRWACWSAAKTARTAAPAS